MEEAGTGILIVIYGVSSLIGSFTGKVLDIDVKSSYCKMCKIWEKRKSTAEYEKWLEDHESECLANHEGSSGKMEVDGMVEMFKRSEELHGVRYKYYIGNGDSKTYTGIVKAIPYPGCEVCKKECIGHVQKRMGRKLHECKKDIKAWGEEAN